MKVLYAMKAVASGSRKLPRVFGALPWLGVILWLACTQAIAGVDVDAFVKQDGFQDIAISPTGEYYAATVPREGRNGLVVVRLSDKKITASIMLGKSARGKDTNVLNFWWVNSNRLVFNVAVRYGALEKPVFTGELYAVDADGGQPMLLVDYHSRLLGMPLALQYGQNRSVVPFVVDDLPGDDKNVVVAVAHRNGNTSAEKLDVYTGQITSITTVPAYGAIFVTDSMGAVRIASGKSKDRTTKLFYREGGDAEWRLINDEAVTHRVEIPVGFSADGKLVYLETEQVDGPNAIIAFDTRSGQRTEALRDRVADPWLMIKATGMSRQLVGVTYMSGKPRTAFFDADSRDAGIYRGLTAAFPDQLVNITSSTADGKLVLVTVSSANNPGDFFLFDVERKKAKLLLSRREWLDPDQMAEVRPVELKSKDGLTLHGYLTLPKIAESRNFPMVIIPHGGPIGIFDKWEFNDDAQLLAQAGYAVLQVNFRGSGNYGQSFEQAGDRQWGGKMQDDLTDATRWAISLGIADPNRICIYGTSYGGYAALMGVAKEPALYKCAAGLVGVYDLALMVGDSKRTSGTKPLPESLGVRRWMVAGMLESAGEGKALDSISPTTAALASRITAPVFLAAGKEDEIAPIAHSRKMEAALRRAGVPVETLYVDHEGHGFNAPENRRAYYVKLLDFLARHIGGAKAN